MGFLNCVTFILLVSTSSIISASDVSENIIKVSALIWNSTEHFGESIELDLQAKEGEKSDDSYSDLILSVDKKVNETESVKLFYTLLDGYEVNDTDTDCVNNFLNEIFDSKPIEELRKYLKDADCVEDDEEFESEFRRIWFSAFEDEALETNTTGFQLTFLGLQSDSSVHTFYNWLQYYSQEQNGNVRYRGYVKNVTIDDLPILSLSFDWEDSEVSKTTIAFGSRPEYEMAIYTLCWYMRPGEDCSVSMGEYDDLIDVKTEVAEYEGERYVKVAYMKINSSGRRITPDILLSMVLSFVLCSKKFLY